MFFVTLVFLMFLGMALHLDADYAGWSWGAVFLLWGLYIGEAVGHNLNDSPYWKKFLWSAAIPPLRLGVRDAATWTTLWIPFLGQVEIDRKTRLLVAKALNGPMLCITLLVIPLLVVEWMRGAPEDLMDLKLVNTAGEILTAGTAINENVVMDISELPPGEYRLELAESSRSESWKSRVSRWLAARPWLLALADLSEAMIWWAFTVEFIIMISLVERKIAYCKEHWIDLAVIFLPLVAFLRMFRLARLGQLSKSARVFRLRGAAVRVKRGVLLLEVIDRLLRGKPQKQLAKLEEALQEKQSEVKDIEYQIRSLRSTLSEEEVDNESTSARNESDEKATPQPDDSATSVASL